MSNYRKNLLLVNGVVLFAMQLYLPISLNFIWMLTFAATGVGAGILASEFYKRSGNNPWQIHLLVLGQALCISLSVFYPVYLVPLAGAALALGIGSVFYSHVKGNNLSASETNTSLMIMVCWVASLLSVVMSPLTGVSSHLFLHDIFLVAWAREQGSCCRRKNKKTLEQNSNFLMLSTVAATLFSTIWMAIGVPGQALLSFMSVLVGICPCVTVAGVSILNKAAEQESTQIKDERIRQDRVSKAYSAGVLALASGAIPKSGWGGVLNQPVIVTTIFMRLASQIQIYNAKSAVKSVKNPGEEKGCCRA